MANWQKKTLGQALAEIVRSYPQNNALIFKESRINYPLLWQEVQALAKGLLALGINRGDKVAVWAANCPEWIFIQLATALIGAILVPVNTRFRLSELEYILKQSDATTLLIMDRFLNIDFLGMLKELCPELSAARPGKLVSQRLPLLKNIILLGESRAEGTFAYGEVINLGKSISDEELTSRMRLVEPDDLLMFQYTSGTTAFPKGVMLTHDGVIHDALCMSQRQTLNAADRLFCPLPFFHVGGAVISTLSVLLCGAAMAFLETYDPLESMRVISKEKCTAMNGIETHFLMIYQHPDFSRYDLSSLKKGWAIGPAEIIRNIYEKMGMTKILNVYGISEASPNVTTTFVDDPLDLRINFHGLPHEGTEIKIVDPQSKQDLPPGKEGEICVRGWNVMKGYYKKPEETARAIDHLGWLHTGDLGLIDPQSNYLKFTGRLKDMLRVGGENVSAMEVENFLLSHPKIKQVQLIGVPDARLTEVGMAFVELKEGETATAEKIIAYCRGKMANFKIPRYVVFVQEFPMTGSGKIQKYKLKEKANEILAKKNG
ncbi:MAG: AMP-binding protein [Thermodesulfobacteriota bacterium]